MLALPTHLKKLIVSCPNLVDTNIVKMGRPFWGLIDPVPGTEPSGWSVCLEHVSDDKFALVFFVLNPPAENIEIGSELIFFSLPTNRFTLVVESNEFQSKN